MAVNLAMTSEGLIFDTTCMYGFLAKRSEGGDPSVPNNADELAELLNLESADDDVKEEEAADVVSMVVAVTASSSSSSSSSSSAVSKESGKLVSLINCRARFKLSESGLRMGSKKSPRSPPLPLLSSEGGGGGRSPPMDEKRDVEEAAGVTTSVVSNRLEFRLRKRRLGVATDVVIVVVD